MTAFAGLKVLVVEDEGSIALLIESMLEDLGCEIVVSAGHLTEAREAAAMAGLNLAVLDVNIDGQPVFPIADILRHRRIPFIFSTGYGEQGLPASLKGHLVLSKPFTLADLKRTISAALDSSHNPGHS